MDFAKWVVSSLERRELAKRFLGCSFREGYKIIYVPTEQSFPSLQPFSTSNLNPIATKINESRHESTSERMRLGFEAVQRTRGGGR